MTPENNKPFSEERDHENKDQEEKRFESDTQKVVRRHMEDPDHKITDEEMADIRVGMSPPVPDEPTKARLEGDDKVDEVEEKILKDRNIEEDQNTGKDKLTPWDLTDS